jgi:hypothetical protein
VGSTCERIESEGGHRWPFNGTGALGKGGGREPQGRGVRCAPHRGERIGESCQ